MTFPQLRALPLNDASARVLLGMPYGPVGRDKAAAEQKLLDQAMEQYRTYSPRTDLAPRQEFSRHAADSPADRPHPRADPAEKRHPADKRCRRSSGTALDIRGDLR